MWWRRATATMAQRNLPDALILVQESRTRRQKRGLILDPELVFLDREIIRLARELEGIPGRWPSDESVTTQDDVATSSAVASSATPAAESEEASAAESKATPAAESEEASAAESKATPAISAEAASDTTTTCATVSRSETPVRESEATAASAETSEGAANPATVRSATPSEGNTKETAATAGAASSAYATSATRDHVLPAAETLPQKKTSTEMAVIDGLEYDPRLFLILNPEVRHQLKSQMLMEKWLLRRCAPTTRVQVPLLRRQNPEDNNEYSSVISVDNEDEREYNWRNGVPLENIVELEKEPRVSFGSRVRAFCRRVGRSLRRCFICGRQRAEAEE